MLLWLPGRASTEHSGQYLITRGHYRLKSPRGAQQEYVQFLWAINETRDRRSLKFAVD